MVFAAGGVEPVRDFEASKAGRFVQSKDKASGLPLWVIDVIDADTSARDKTARVKVAAVDQPVLPPAHPGMPFVPVEFAGLTVTPRARRSHCGRYGDGPAGRQEEAQRHQRNGHTTGTRTQPGILNTTQRITIMPLTWVETMERAKGIEPS